ncbi:MAG: succinate dehydrogenase cytochrome b subunit [Bacteroidia bacterium]|nr:succinate dehydrogenase cytochrome b subunit [Bacteroidia bacterium]
MSNFLSASIGRKVFMSLTGLFLISFLLIHLTLNLFLIFDDSGNLFNQAAHFMATNPMIRIVEPILALGFIIHIIWSGWITLENMKARPQGYASGDKLLKWWEPSKNMFILGGMIFIFLVLHILNFWVKMKITGDPLLDQANGTGEEMHNAYALVSNLFINNPLYDIIYMIGGIFVGLHITHGFWSAFQTIGLSNINWMKRLKFVANLIGFVFAIGFSSIPLYFLIKF